MNSFFLHCSIRLFGKPFLFRTVSLCSFCVSSLFFCGCGCEPAKPVAQAIQKHLELSITRQLTLEHDTSLPVAVVDGFVVADETGNVCHFDHSYNSLWSVKHNGMEFNAAAAVEKGHLFLGSVEGSVICMDVDDGSTLWTNALDASFMYSPLYGEIKDKDVIWLLSSDDGVIYCLNAESGKLLWKSEETNRSDGGMVLWKERLVYGNCDGAAHIFNAVDGSKIASVPVGESDQMAGTPVVTDKGMLFIGTRQGNLAVIDIEEASLCSTLKISEQEAFAVPVLCGDDTVAFGVQEGDLILLGVKDRSPFVKNRYPVGSEIEYLLCDENMLCLLANGSLMAFDENLKLLSSINVGDRFSGFGSVGSGLFAVKADNSLLFVKGEWK